MAATQYQVFIRYFNNTVNECIDNKTDCTWTNADKALKANIKASDDNLVEIVKIRSDTIVKTDYEANELEDAKYYDIIQNEANIHNPKYNMVFMYTGIAILEGETSVNSKAPDKTKPILYYDNMQRIDADPWFLNSTHGSLKSAMNKVDELVELLGKANVKVGKVVPLDQYIEIV